MKRLLLVIFLVSAASLSWASHIVGGEFELIHQEGFTYKIRLILYFDVVNGNPGAFDNTVNVSIFQSADDSRVRNITIPYARTTRVDYFQPACSNGEVVTDKIIYEIDWYFDPRAYDDPEGYYLVWQRCCRNYTISNIFSAPPQQGVSAGQTFYLKFPPVVDENGEPFVNSSPQLFPPLNDYACPNRPYWVDFAGVDFDGDSLVYSLASPLSTQFESALPPNGENLAAPYPVTIWKPGFDLNNIMNGFPPLRISDEGFLTVTPLSQGLFVFAVQVDEFRDGVKIGEVRRDFQMLVVDKCPLADPPQVIGYKIDQPNLGYDNNMSVTFNQGIAQEERCIIVEVSDLDSQKAVDDFSEWVLIRAIPIGFKDNVSEVLPTQIGATLTNGSTAEFEICFPECPYVEDGPFQIGIVAFDDACALPLTDTLKVDVTIQPPPNTPPYFETADIDLTVLEAKDGFFSADIVARDADNDTLELSFFPQDFVLEDFGMTVEQYVDQPGEIRTRFDWNYDCLQTSFDGKQQFEIFAVVDDYDFCQFAHPDTLEINLEIILPDNTFPEIFSEDLGDREDDYFKLERELLETINFDIFAEDLDNDPIRVMAEGANFSLGLLGAQFPTVEGTGNPGLEATFNWYLDCLRFNLAAQDSFRFYLFVEDIDYCNITSMDTLTVDVIVSEPENVAPEFTFISATPLVTVDGNQGSMTVGDPLILNVIAEDANPNFVDLELVRVEGEDANQNFAFENASGFKKAASKLIWVPDCEALALDQPSSKYTFTFRATDDYCIENASNEVQFVLTVNDIEPEPTQFLPPNFFSPNGDEYNSFFALEWTDENGQEFTTGLPLDNCAGTFIEVKIINRWGREVYRSGKRDFRWYGDGEPSGVYYYYVKYTNREFKGSITMLY